jgi:hypothetical protein
MRTLRITLPDKPRANHFRVGVNIEPFVRVFRRKPFQFGHIFGQRLLAFGESHLNASGGF